MASDDQGNSRKKLDLGASDMWYRELFEQGLGYLCTHTLDGTLLTANPAAAGALGYDPNELAGQPFERLLAPSVRHFFPQYLERLRSTGRANGVLRVLSKGGDEYLWLYRNVVVDEPSSVPYVLGYAQDVTDLRNTILSERQAASDYRALVEYAGYGIYRATMDGRFLMVNPALVAMLGYESEAELLEVNVATDVYADDEVRELLVEQHRNADSIEEFETRWRRRDDKIITVTLSGRLVRNSQGTLECYEMFAKDVSEQRALEEQLRHAQKMELVGQLTGGMAHDFNNLLTVILANAALIGAALPANAEGTRTDLEELEAAARRGGAMIKRLLSFSRRVQFPPQPVDIGPSRSRSRTIWPSPRSRRTPVPSSRSWSIWPPTPETPCPTAGYSAWRHATPGWMRRIGPSMDGGIRVSTFVSPRRTPAPAWMRRSG
jgi:PAS domain S-box-containing protein